MPPRTAPERFPASEREPAAGFRFAAGQRVRVLTHPARPGAEVTARWSGAAAGDPYGENVYAVSGFITRQRESSLAAEGFLPLHVRPL